MLWRKGCFGTHSAAGNRFVERMLTVTATLKQQRRNVVDYVTEACVAALHHQPAPSLLPSGFRAVALAPAAACRARTVTFGLAAALPHEDPKAYEAGCQEEQGRGFGNGNRGRAHGDVNSVTQACDPEEVDGERIVGPKALPFRPCRPRRPAAPAAPLVPPRASDDRSPQGRSQGLSGTENLALIADGQSGRDPAASKGGGQTKARAPWRRGEGLPRWSLMSCWTS